MDKENNGSNFFLTTKKIGNENGSKEMALLCDALKKNCALTKLDLSCDKKVVVIELF